MSLKCSVTTLLERYARGGSESHTCKSQVTIDENQASQVESWLLLKQVKSSHC